MTGREAYTIYFQLCADHYIKKYPESKIGPNMKKEPNPPMDAELLKIWDVLVDKIKSN